MSDYKHTFSDLYSRVQDYAGDKTTQGAARAKAAVNDALKRIAQERRWLALRRQGTITPVANTQSYVLTTSAFDYFAFPVRVFYYLSGMEHEIDIVNEEKWSSQHDKDNAGTPDICAFLDISGATKLYLSPIPTASFVSLYSTIYIDFDREPTELSSDSDKPEIPSTNSQMSIIYFAVGDRCAKQGDLQGASVWESKALKELSRGMSNDSRRRSSRASFGKPDMGILDGHTSKVSRDYN